MKESIILVATALTITFSASAQNAADLEDLVGARAAGAETQLEARGYELRQTNTVRDQRYTFWWNPRNGRCVSVSTMEGRYASIIGVPAGNCDASPAQGTPQGAGVQDPQSLVLVCYGGGARPSVKNDPTYKWDSEKHRWQSEDHLVSSKEGFSSDVQIELYGDHGRIHLGQDLVPPIHSGGHNGWWDFDNLSVTPDRITASYRLNGMNRPQVTVDRRSGRISIKSQTEFTGQCDAGNWGGSARRF